LCAGGTTEAIAGKEERNRKGGLRAGGTTVAIVGKEDRNRNRIYMVYIFRYIYIYICMVLANPNHT
jgi:hypothetical protein